MKKERESKTAFRTSIGGQALIEGILMRGPEKQAIVLHTKDGFTEKVEELHPLKEKYPVLGWPIIRGVVNFVASMAAGIRALTYSAENLPEEEQEKPSKFDLWMEKKLGVEKAQKLVIGIAMFLGVVLELGLFFVLPSLLGELVGKNIQSFFLRNLVEGLIRILIFLGYMFAVTASKDIKRTFQYHGAEHKSIFCYEKGLPLTVENVRVQSKHHPRCGTSFLFVVMIISILVFSLVSWPGMHVAARIGLRILLLPLVVALSYEFNRLVGRYDNVLTRILSAPGKALQFLTTAEPDEAMMETAIRALELVIPEKKGADKW